MDGTHQVKVGSELWIDVPVISGTFIHFDCKQFDEYSGNHILENVIPNPRPNYTPGSEMFQHFTSTKNNLLPHNTCSLGQCRLLTESFGSKSGIKNSLFSCLGKCYCKPFLPWGWESASWKGGFHFGANVGFFVVCVFAHHNSWTVCWQKSCLIIIKCTISKQNRCSARPTMTYSEPL